MWAITEELFHQQMSQRVQKTGSMTAEVESRGVIAARLGSTRLVEQIDCSSKHAVTANGIDATGFFCLQMVAHFDNCIIELPEQLRGRRVARGFQNQPDFFRADRSKFPAGVLPVARA
jgi:hypothetical protein